MEKIYKVGGMTCEGCVRSLERAIKSAAPAARVSVDLSEGKVAVDGAEEAAVARAVDDAGFEFLGAA